MRIREDRSYSVQDNQGTSGFHVHLIRLFEAVDHGCVDALVDTQDDCINKLLMGHAIGRVESFASEATIALTFQVPVGLLTQMAQLVEELQEEDSEVLGFFFRAEVDGWDNALKDLSVEAEEVKVGNAELM